MKIAQCALIALLGSTSTAAWAAPSVTLNSSTDHPQATDKVSGSGFPAYAAIDIYWDTTDILLGTSDGNGNFGPLKYKVPSDALPGEHWISAVSRKKGIAAQALFTVNTDWAQRGFNASGKRYNPWENVITPDNVDQLEVAWTFTTGNYIESSPAVVNGILYIGSNDGVLYALDATTGNLKCSDVLGAPIDYSSPAVANGIVYIGSTDGNLYALDAVTCATKWAYQTGGVIESSPTVANGTVYFGSNDGNLYAVNATTGALLWSATTTANAAIYGAPAVVKGGTVYIGSGDHKVYAFDVISGALVWNFYANDVVLASPAVSNGHLYIGSYDAKFYTINAGTGGLEASDPFNDSGVFASAAVAKGVVYWGNFDGYLSAARYFPGYGMYHYWNYGNLGSIISSPAVANGVVYAGAYSSVSAFDASTNGGQLVWSADTGGVVTSSPAIANGMLYIGSLDHNIYAYALNGGNNKAYKLRHTQPPPLAMLHPDLRLELTR